MNLIAKATPPSIIGRLYHNNFLIYLLQKLKESFLLSFFIPLTNIQIRIFDTIAIIKQKPPRRHFANRLLPLHIPCTPLLISVNKKHKAKHKDISQLHPYKTTLNFKFNSLLKFLWKKVIYEISRKINTRHTVLEKDKFANIV